MADKNCNKCVYHTSGKCSSWECLPTTLKDVEKATVDTLLKMVERKADEVILANEKNADFVDGVKFTMNVVDYAARMLKG